MTDIVKITTPYESTLQWSFEHEGESTVIYLRGVLDELAHLSALAKLVKSEVVLDLEGVSRITSYGAQQWIRFMEQIDRVGPHQLRRCSIAIVAQLNILPSFAGQTRVTSIMGPFLCPVSDEEFTIEIPIEDNVPKMPTPVHPKSGEKLEFDDIESSYFSFLQE